MRVLIVSSSFPSNLRVCTHGVFKRLEMYIDAIKQIAQLCLLFYVSPDIDVSPSRVSDFERTLAKQWGVDFRLILCRRNEIVGKAPKWFRYGMGIFSFFAQTTYKYTSGARQLEAFDRALQFSPDVIFAHRLSSMCPPLLNKQALPKILFDLDDIEHIAQLRTARQSADLRSRMLSYLYLPMLEWGERRAVQLADKTFVCSESDRRYLTDRWGLPGIFVVPNAVVAAQAEPISAEPILLFVGSFLYEPNVQAAKFLIEKVWPRIRGAVPSARLLIAGSQPDRIGCARNGASGVELIGFVDDLEGLYRRASIIVVPVLSGSGTRVKLIEAAAYGKPIVATTIGAEGLEMRDGYELLIRDGANSFADACRMLLDKPALREQLGRAAHVAIIKYYNRQQAVNLIKSHLKQYSARKGSSIVAEAF